MSAPGQTCPVTGLRIVPTNQRLVYRLAKVSYEPLSPPERDSGPTPVTEWNRWDTPGGRTVYGADSPEACYLEALAAQAPAPTLDSQTGLPDNPDGPSATASLLTQIRQDWDGEFHFAPGCVPQAWRDERRLYRLWLPPTGWAVDVEHEDSLAAINRALAHRVFAVGGNRIDRGHLLGSDREVTVLIARWLRSLVLDDGTFPHRIAYGSKHGEDQRCWAIWMRELDDGKPLSSEPTTRDNGHLIERPEKNPPLHSAASRLGLTVH